MSQAVQIICASGIFGTIITLVITRIVNSQLDQIKALKKSESENDFLLWTKIDKMGSLIELMAAKLHEAGVINGDLEEVKKEYKVAEDEYQDHLKRLAAVVLRK